MESPWARLTPIRLATAYVFLFVVLYTALFVGTANPRSGLGVDDDAAGLAILMSQPTGTRPRTSGPGTASGSPAVDVAAQSPQSLNSTRTALSPTTARKPREGSISASTPSTRGSNDDAATAAATGSAPLATPTEPLPTANVDVPTHADVAAFQRWHPISSDAESEFTRTGGVGIRDASLQGLVDLLNSAPLDILPLQLETIEQYERFMYVWYHQGDSE